MGGSRLRCVPGNISDGIGRKSLGMNSDEPGFAVEMCIRDRFTMVTARTVTRVSFSGGRGLVPLEKEKDQVISWFFFCIESYKVVLMVSVEQLWLVRSGARIPAFLKIANLGGGYGLNCQKSSGGDTADCTVQV